MDIVEFHERPAFGDAGLSPFDRRLLQRVRATPPARVSHSVANARCALAAIPRCRRPRSHLKVSVVSLSRSVCVNDCCFRSDWPESRSCVRRSLKRGTDRSPWRVGRSCSRNSMKNILGRMGKPGIIIHRSTVLIKPNLVQNSIATHVVSLRIR